MEPSPGAPQARAKRLKSGLVLLLFAVVVTFCAVLLWPRRRAPSPTAPPPTADTIDFSGTAHALTGPAATPRSPTRLPPRPPPAPAAPPIIDDIVVEKAEVCEGEENLITVRAHTPDGQDAFLHYQIGPSRGSSVALRSFLDNGDNPTAHRIMVFSRGNVATAVAVPAYRVKKCGPIPVVGIDYRLLPNTWAELELTGKIGAAVSSRTVASPPPPPFHPRRYRWSFGGAGGEIESESPSVTHSFAARPQATLYSTFVVTLNVVAEDGRTARARQSIELLNPAFEAFAAKGVVQLMIELTPRFPTISDSGLVEQGVRLWHARSQAIEITSVTLVHRPLRSGRGDERPAFREHPSVAAVLGATEVPPGGEGLEMRAFLDTRREPDTLSLDYTLEGRTPEGYPVRGAFSIMRPPPRPTRERSDAIRDPLLVAKIKRARELLHAEYVTDEDLWALEREGRFAGLEVEPTSSSTATPPSTPPANVPGR